MNVITTIPWHLYVTMFLFALTIGLLTAFELQEVRTDRHARPLRHEPRNQADQA